MTDKTERKPKPVTPLHRADREQRTRWLTDARDRQFRRDLTRLPELVALVAARLGRARLIDNLRIVAGPPRAT